MARRAKSAEAKTPSTAFDATRLLGRWTKLAQGHVMFGSGCSCGVGSGNLRLQDFEQQILDYLHARHGAAAVERAGYREREAGSRKQEAGSRKQEAGSRKQEAGSVASLLRAIATQGVVEPPANQLALLADLERSIDSFDELHRGR